jgi:SAM-dependent methyltransferase
MSAGRAAQLFNRALRRSIGYQFVYAMPNPRYEDYGSTARPLDPTYINIGAGYRIHPMWHALENPRPDYRKSRDADIAFDLTSGEKWPVPSDTVELLFTSHTIEHLNDQFNADMFREAYRTLKPGGLFRITCPNVDLYVDAYERRDEHFFRYLMKTRPGAPLPYSMEQVLLFAFAGPLSSIHKESNLTRATDDEVRLAHATMPRDQFLDSFTSRIAVDVVRRFPKEHKTWLTPAKLIRMLNDAGFEAWECAHGQSKSHLMRNVEYFDIPHPSVSLYVEARKP